MEYTAISFHIANGSDRDLLLAALTDAGVEGFEERDDVLIAYMQHDMYNEALINEIAVAHKVDYDIENIPRQNWNEEWERNFKPVIVNDFCTVRADFHHIQVSTPYEIVITPKMSFGTGHHATTQLMITEMKSVQWAGTKVLDFGTGTGILAILAEMLGAQHVVAIDNDEWAYENAKENVTRNNCSKIEILLGSLEDVPGSFNIILANINRHILLQYMGMLWQKLDIGGTMLLSGLLKEDKDVILSAAINAGFKDIRSAELNNWLALVFEK